MALTRPFSYTGTVAPSAAEASVSNTSDSFMHPMSESAVRNDAYVLEFIHTGLMPVLPECRNAVRRDSLGFREVGSRKFNTGDFPPLIESHTVLQPDRSGKKEKEGKGM